MEKVMNGLQELVASVDAKGIGERHEGSLGSFWIQKEAKRQPSPLRGGTDANRHPSPSRGGNANPSVRFSPPRTVGRLSSAETISRVQYPVSVAGGSSVCVQEELQSEANIVEDLKLRETLSQP